MHASTENGPLQLYGCYFRSLLLGIGIPESAVPSIYEKAVSYNALPIDCFVDPNKLVPFLNDYVLPEYLPKFRLRYLGYSTFQRTDCCNVVGVIGQIPEPLASWHVCNSRAQAEKSEYVKNLVLLSSINKGDYDYFDFISEVNGTSTKIRDPNDTNFWTAVNMEEPC